MMKTMSKRRTARVTRATLESMVRERDERIVALEKERTADRKALAELKAELDESKSVYKQEIAINRVRQDTLHREKESMREEVDTLTRDMDPERLLCEYVETLRTHAKTDAKFTAALETQLCRAIHKVEVVKHQLNQVKASSESMKKSLQEEIASAVKESSASETNLTNQLAALHQEMRLKEEKYRLELQEKMERIYSLEERLQNATEMDSSDEASANAFHSPSPPTRRGKRRDDLSTTLNAVKEQLNVVAQEKETMENNLTLRLQESEENVMLFKKVCEAKDKIIEGLMRDNPAFKADSLTPETKELLGSPSLSLVQAAE